MSNTTMIKVGESAKTITLPEGRALVLTGAPGTSGVAYLLDQALGGTNSLRSWTVGAGALAAIGPYENTQKIHITCSAGSIAATVKEAVLTISATPAPTVPGQPAKPVLTAMAGAVSLAWTPGAAGSTATTGNIWTDINGNVTQLTTNPQTITAPAGTPYTGTVTTLNAQGSGPASVQADAVTPTATPAMLRTFETFDVNGNNTNTFNRVAVAETGRTSLIIRSPASNTAQIALGYRDADNLNNPNPDFSAPVLINPGEEMFSDNDQMQYYARQNAATAVTGQFVEVERVITL